MRHHSTALVLALVSLQALGAVPALAQEAETSGAAHEPAAREWAEAEAEDAAPPRARPARSQSLLTVALGVELGYGQHVPRQGDPAGAFVAELTGKVRLLRVLALQIAYNFAGAADTGDLVLSSNFRLTGALYLVPDRRVSVYILGGVGARDARDLFSVTAPTNSYHLGIGLEIYIGRRFAIAAEYRWVVPGYASMEAALSADLDDTLSQVEDVNDVEAAAGLLDSSLPRINVTDFLDGGNFQVSLGARFYL